MKNFIKLLGIAALVAVIGFSMIACGGGGGSSPSDGGGSNNATFTIKNQTGEGISSVRFEDIVGGKRMQPVIFNKIIPSGGTSDPYKISWSSENPVEQFVFFFKCGDIEYPTVGFVSLGAKNGGSYTITIKSFQNHDVIQDPDPFAF